MPRRRAALVAAPIASLIALVIALPSSAMEWTLDRIAGRDVDSMCMQLDSADHPVVLLGGDLPRLAIWDGAAWSIEELPSALSCMQSPSLKLDATGEPVISFVEGSTGDLTLATRVSGTWRLETVDVAGEPGRGNSLALDSSGHAVIAYSDRINGDLKLAHSDGASWVVETVDSVGNVGASASLVLDAAGGPWISYMDLTNADLKVAHWSAGAWSLEIVDTAAAWPGTTSLALDPAGNPAVSYEDSVTGDIRVARRGASTWSIDVIESGSGGSESMIAFDAAGNLEMAYIAGASTLRHARWDGAAWLRETVDSGPQLGFHPCIAMDAAHRPVIAYFDDTQVRPKLARWDGASWQLDVIESCQRVGSDLGLALDATNHALVAFIDRVTHDVILARETAGGWSMEVLGNSGSVTENIAVELDSTGHPSIVYWHATPGGSDLRLATSNGTTWNTEVVESVPVSGNPALAFDTSDVPSIAYTDTRSFTVSWARRTPTGWSVRTLGGGSRPSLALDAVGEPFIAFVDPAARPVLAHWTGSTWTTERIDPAALVNATMSLRLDAAGNPIVSYADGSTHALHVARRLGSSWSIETVPGASAGYATKLRLDGAERPSIAYYDWAQPDITLARWTGAAWELDRLGRAGQIHSGFFGGLSLALDSADSPVLAFLLEPCGSHYSVELARPALTLMRRWLVASTAPGWQASVFPLTDANDDETPPFPLTMRMGETAPVTMRTGEPLVLFDAEPLDGAAAGILRVTKSMVTPGDVELSY